MSSIRSASNISTPAGGVGGGGGDGNEATRTGVFSFIPTHSSTTFLSASMTIRRPFIIPQTVSRFRVHMRNRNQLSNTNVTGSWTALAMYVGQAALGADGAPNGNMTAAPVQIPCATTLASGAELISDWVAPSTFTIARGKHHLLSICGTNSANNWALTTGVTWRSTSLSDVSLQNMAGTVTYDTSNGLLDVWIEYEFADDSAPIIIVVGNSLSGRSNSLWGSLDAWPHLWERLYGGTAVNIAAAGSWTTHYGASDAKWNIYDTCETAIAPDAVVFLGLTSSDIAAGTSIATIKTNMLTAMTKAKTKWPNARIIISNQMPRSDGNTGTPEANRLTMNTWLESLPGGADYCIDLNSALIDWAASPLTQRSVYEVDGIHQSAAGEIQVAGIIPVGRM